MHSDGSSLVPEDFKVFDSELDLVPSPDTQPLWEPSALKEAMAGFDSYRSVILTRAQDLLDELTKGRRPV
jgi:hypothetical protein